MISSILVVAVVVGGARLSEAQSSQDEPCGQIQPLLDNWYDDNPNAEAAIIPGELAMACLQSVPLDSDEDLSLIDEIRLYLQWQSSLSYLTDPPEQYTGERINLFDSLSAIEDKVRNNTYGNEYDFQLDIHRALLGAYDFHLEFRPDIANVIRYQRGNGYDNELFSPISISTDGSAVPVLYNYYDLLLAQNDTSFNASTITQINGEPAEDYLNNFSTLMSYHDSDARYNRLFINQAGLASGDPVDSFISGIYYDGPTTNVTFANGTERSYINYGVISSTSDFSRISDGRDFFAAFCNQEPPSDSNSKHKFKRSLTPSVTKRQNQQSPPVAESAATATGYPEPIVLHSEGVIGGYYLDGQGFENIAVLSVPSFAPSQDGPAVEFQNLVQGFLQNSTDAGKTRLIIDLRNNGGGRIFLGYDMFKQLFPTEDPYGATRLRANDAFNQMGLAVTEALQGVTEDDVVQTYNANGFTGLVQAWRSYFNFRLPRTADNQPFGSWPDLFGPHEFNGDNFTSLQRYNLSNALSDDLDIDVSGYRTRANDLRSSPPFSADNIVLIQDGACGSTCAIFAELMKSQGGVQQIVMGGKPGTQGAMQGVAGSKGAQVNAFAELQQQAAQVYDFLSQDVQSEINSTDIGKLVFATRPLRRAALVNGVPLARVNTRDNIRLGDNNQTPLEFVYEAADCRLFYTREMVFDPTPVWEAVANARWNNGQGCVSGSTGDKTSVGGGFNATQNPDPRGNGNGNGGDGEGAGVVLSVSRASMLLAGLVSVGFLFF